MLRSIRHIRPRSVAPVFGAISFLAGLVTLALLLGSAAFAPAPITTSHLGMFSFRGMPPLPLLIAWPFIAGLWGAFSAAVGAWLYNCVVRITGPVWIELGDDGETR